VGKPPQGNSGKKICDSLAKNARTGEEAQTSGGRHVGGGALGPVAVRERLVRKMKNLPQVCKGGKKKKEGIENLDCWEKKDRG